MVLSETDREKVDTSPDPAFYDRPRFVTHVDDAFLERLTALYADLLSPGDRVFDAMSSHVSHLPDAEFERVVGHGLNRTELAANPALDEWFLQDLNADQSLPLSDGAFDAVLCAVSVQYLQYPAAVFAEFRRVLAPGGVLVVSFSDRMFPTKAVRAWRTRSMDGRADLVCEYVDAAGGFGTVEVVREQPGPGADPFYAVVARRSGGPKKPT
nr:methyltransferase domain-containing protein [Salinirussus salinus]